MSHNQILGDGNRRSRFDPTLADRLNREAEKFSEKVKKVKIGAKSINLDDISESPGEYIVGNSFAINMMPGDMHNPWKDHDSWTEYWHNHDLVMASMPEFYQVFKQITHDLQSNVAHKLVKAHAMINNLRYQMRQGHLIITDTRITYGVNLNDFSEVHIDHRFGYDNSNLWHGCDAKVNYRKGPFNSIMHMSADADDVDFIRRALLETEDDMDKISSSLRFVNETSDELISISTLHDDKRKNGTINKYAALAMDEECFRIKLNLDDPIGLSYGIRYLDQGGSR
jgi:hypothetical protein